MLETREKRFLLFSRKTRRKHSNKKKTAKRSWGYQLMINAGGCDPEAIRSKKVIRAFVAELVHDIHMIAYGAPRIVRFGRGDLVGLTLVQLIEKSDITAHFIEKTNDAYMDVFSCKTFDTTLVIRLFVKYFSPQRKTVHFFTRQA